MDDLESFLSTKNKSPLSSSEGIQSVTSTDIREWLLSLSSQGLAAKTLARKKSAVNAYFHFLLLRGLIVSNPAKGLKTPKIQKKLPHFLKEREVQILLDQIPFPNTFEGIRDKAMLEVLYGCGLRRAELIGLQWDQVQWATHQLIVKGKGNKYRQIPFGSQVRKSLEPYRQVRQTLNLPEKGPVFTRSQGQPLYPKLVYNTVKHYLSLISNLPQKSPHILRHSYATHLLDRGADLNAIKELLGHSSLAATQVYTHNTISKLQKVHKQAHPRAEEETNVDRL